MKKYKVRLIKEDKEAYGGDLGRHGGGGRVRMSQSIKKGDTVQFQVADYRTNTRKYYKGIVMMLLSYLCQLIRFMEITQINFLIII